MQFHYAARDGVCGDGRGMLRAEGTWWSTTSGTFTDLSTCSAGPVRAVITRDGNDVLRIQLVAGPLTRIEGVTDLGAVPAAEAGQYFVQLARTLEGRAARSAVLAAAVADSANVGDALLGIARDAEKPRELRSSALTWGARRGDVATLIALTERNDDPWLAGEAASALARVQDPRARVQLRRLVESRNTPEAARVRMIGALGGSDATAADAAALRNAYPHFTDRERTAAIQAVAAVGDAASRAFLLARARDAAESMEVRRAALQRGAATGIRAADLATLFDGVPERELRLAILDALATNGSRVALDKLASVAESTGDVTVRRRAITKLADTGDPRSKRLLETLAGR